MTSNWIGPINRHIPDVYLRESLIPRKSRFPNLTALSVYRSTTTVVTMRALFTINLLLLAFVHGAAQTAPPSQQAFCRFIAAFNRQELNEVYEALSPVFQGQVDRAVCTGGLQHVYRTNGAVLSAAVAFQTTDEGIYFAITEGGVFRVMLSVDSQQRIDGLRIQQVERNTPMPLASLVFRSDGSRQVSTQ